MKKISLYSNQLLNVTIVSNLFIDYYMPIASGSFVKVYLYLLRCLSEIDFEFSISEIADRLEESEKDIVRALSYWEKVQLITLIKDNEGQITSIILNQIESLKKELPIQDIGDPLSCEKVVFLPETVATVTKLPIEETEQTILDKPIYTTAQINELTNTKDIKWSINIIEKYLERLLQPMDIQLILYLYENLGFPPELIVYLYEYCISKGKKNLSYIEAVALSWAKQEIDTLEKAQASVAQYNSNYHAINKAFGLNRFPAAAEQKYINTWLNTYGFNIDIVVEACNRTILAIKQPDFKYANGILEKWKTSNVKTLEDIENLDTTHKLEKNTNFLSVNATTKKSTNKFNVFPQRNYSKEDFLTIEQRLLNRNRY